MRPLLAVSFLQAADDIELQNLAAKFIKMILRVVHLIAHGFPFVAKLLKQNIKLRVGLSREPEFGFEVFDAEVQNLIL